jgi:transcriptional regulator with GAF, ATPase, and Fis domain
MTTLLAEVAPVQTTVGPTSEDGANCNALIRVFEALASAKNQHELMHAVLESVLESFGWAYASYWNITQTEQNQPVLTCSFDFGQASDAFRTATRRAKFSIGTGLPGVACQIRDFVFLNDVATAKNFPRAEAALASGIKSGFSVPVMMSSNVVGAIEFFSNETLSPSEERLTALRGIRSILAAALERLHFAERLHGLAEQAHASKQIMAEAAQTMHHTHALVEKLGHSSKDVGETIATIQKVANHTKILALNATIESARAGEAGRGFAVVAAAVKGLAEESNLAANRIRERIGAMQNDAAEFSSTISEMSTVISRTQEFHELIGNILKE